MPELAFTLLTALAVATAIMALEAREVVYGAVSLAIMFLAMAGFFILLDAPFVAMFQVIVYVGAVAVLILFTVMLVSREKWIKDEVSGLRLVGTLLGLTLALSFGLLLLNSTAGFVTVGGGVTSLFDIGAQMVSDYWVALEVLALLLAASLIGALTLAKVNREE